jgi:hypothetical protein
VAGLGTGMVSISNVKRGRVKKSKATEQKEPDDTP